MTDQLSDEALDIIFREARSYNRWQDRTVPDSLLHELYDLMKWGPTSANCCPSRFLFLKSEEARERLVPHLLEGNVVKVRTAPVVAIIGSDPKFYDHIPKLFPHNPEAREWFSNDEDVAAETAFRNGTLQGAYLMIAARALGLDCGPMSGFDQDGVNREFFPEGEVVSNFLCALGYGTEEELFPRLPRFEFDEVSEIL